MTDRHAIQTPLDLSDWTQAGGPDEAGGIPDVEQLQAWAREERRNPTPPSEDDELKEALRLQQHEDKFVVPDPTDHLSDDELWELMPESIRRNS